MTLVRVPLGFTAIADLSAAVGLGTIPTGATMALIQPETKSIRFRDDGTDPTSSAGHLLAAGDTLEYDGDLSAIKLIETEASASVNVTFYR